MAGPIKNQKEILEKLSIEKLNNMQEEAKLAIHSSPEIVLLSPTGTGKTLAFLLPIIAELKDDCEDVQVLILAPSRELAMQIEQVTREMGSGYKTNAVYGGRAVSKDKIDLKHSPSILIGTPGRVADHIRRGSFKTTSIQTLVLDEFDKSLEIGFEADMEEIISALPGLKKKILTSATQEIEIPKFVGLRNPKYLDFLEEGGSKLKLKAVLSPSKDKLHSLLQTLQHTGNQPGIIFCNFRDSIERVSDFLYDNDIRHSCFHGGMEQMDRERALIKFRNGTNHIILATDLAARGIDVPEIQFIIHYHLPVKAHEFTHRNGRTARMNKEGTAYVIQYELEDLPDFIDELDPEIIQSGMLEASTDEPDSKWETLFLSGGRKDKISKGDIAGLFFKQGKLAKGELGIIEIKQDCAFVAVVESKVRNLIPLIDNTRLKKKKVRVKRID